MRKLEKLQIQNFKSIRDQTLELGALNVLIGANGAGKSNLVQAFRFLREIATRNLARYSLERGADALLFRGRKFSSSMEFQIQFGEGYYSNSYHIRLIPTDENTLAVESETAFFHNRIRHPKNP
jgi:predicted ATPase